MTGHITSRATLLTMAVQHDMCVGVKPAEVMQHHEVPFPVM